jgi:DNA helicase-2/ATP-dependent DNA helicase PcrA
LITNETQNFQAQSIKDRADILEIYSQPSSSDLAVYAVENYLHVTNFEEVTRNSAATQQDADNILSNIEAFRQIASRHKGTIGEFLDEIDPMVDIATEDPPKYPHVWIGSIHRAKGAQWSTVFVPGLVAGVFPKNSSDVSILEAERRLFYVATTRATKHLYLAHPYDEKFRVVAENIKHPGFSVNTSPISSFVWEMNLAVSIHAGQAIESGANFESVEIDRPEIANQYFKQFPFAMNWNYGKRHQKAVAGNAQLPTLTPEYRMHSRVSHEVLGAGVVSDVSPFGIVLINFDNGDSKRFRSSDRQLSLAPELGF